MRTDPAASARGPVAASVRKGLDKSREKYVDAGFGDARRKMVAWRTRPCTKSVAEGSPDWRE